MYTFLIVITSFSAGFYSAMRLVRWTWRRTMTGAIK